MKEPYALITGSSKGLGRELALVFSEKDTTSSCMEEMEQD